MAMPPLKTKLIELLTKEVKRRQPRARDSKLRISDFNNRTNASAVALSI